MRGVAGAGHDRCHRRQRSAAQTEEPKMWKKLALLAAVASAVTQAVRYWKTAGTKTVVQHKREARHAVQRWEDEGGNLRPEPTKPA
jgi:hypothetical protein